MHQVVLAWCEEAGYYKDSANCPLKHLDDYRHSNQCLEVFEGTFQIR